MSVTTIIRCDGVLSTGNRCTKKLEQQVDTSHAYYLAHTTHGWHFTLENHAYCFLCTRDLKSRSQWPPLLFSADPCEAPTCKGGQLNALLGHTETAHRTVRTLRGSTFPTVDELRLVRKEDIKDFRTLGERSLAFVRCAMYGTPLPPGVYATRYRAVCYECPNPEVATYFGHDNLGHRMTSQLYRNGIATMAALAQALSSDSSLGLHGAGPKTIARYEEAVELWRSETSTC